MEDAMIGYVVEATRPNGRRFLLTSPAFGHDRVKIYTKQQEATTLANALNAVMQERRETLHESVTSYRVLPYPAA